MLCAWCWLEHHTLISSSISIRNSHVQWWTDPESHSGETSVDLERRTGSDKGVRCRDNKQHHLGIESTTTQKCLSCILVSLLPVHDEPRG